MRIGISTSSQKNECELGYQYSVAYKTIMGMERIVRAVLEDRKWTQAQLARRLGTTQVTVSRWLAGSEPRGDMRDKIRAIAADLGVLDEEPKDRHFVPIIGKVGAGNKIHTEFEQPPPDGFDQVELPFELPGDMVGFEVEGESMFPRYDRGDIIIVPAEPRRVDDDMIYKEAVVETDDRVRYLKRIMPGPGRHKFNLESVNAPTITARLLSASEVWAVVKSGHARRIGRKGRPGAQPRAARRMR